MEDQINNEHEILEEEIAEDQESQEAKPSLVINVHSWWTVIVGIVMLVIGLLGGYALRPFIPLGSSELAAANASTNPPGGSQSVATTDPNTAASRQEMMDFLVSQTRHIKGNPDAEVYILEFSDYQ